MTRRDPARWFVTIFVLNLCLQRLSIPTLSIPITMPISIAWVALALRAGVVELNRVRLLLWLVAAGVSALLVIPQLLLVAQPYISVTSWAYWMAVWSPMVVSAVDRSPQLYLRVCRGIAHAGLAFSALSIIFIVVQLLGVQYRDVVADVVPHALLVTDYTTTYPITYGSSIYKSNGWIALEASFMSFTIGVSIVCAIVARLRVGVVLVLVLGMLSTTAGSGIAIVAVFVLVSLLTGRWDRLRKHVVPNVVLLLAFGVSTLGASLTSRLTEAGSSDSSTSLRATEPYLYLWPHWVSDPAQVFLGGGAGSSRLIISGSGVTGLLVPTPAKVLFDYGIFGGLLLLGLVVAAYLRSPEPAMAAALAVSMLTLQGASAPLVLCSFIVVTFWAPSQSGRSSAFLPAGRARLDTLSGVT